MRAFVSYRHTGADADSIGRLLVLVRDALAIRGIEIRNTFFDVRGGNFAKSRQSPVEFMEHAFKMMDSSDFLLVLQTSEDRSEGMLMEVGYALAKGQPVVVANQATVTRTYLPEMATVAFSWRDEKELEQQLAQLDMGKIGT